VSRLSEFDFVGRYRYGFAGAVKAQLTDLQASSIGWDLRRTVANGRRYGL
jgi:hypothetical protein